MRLEPNAIDRATNLYLRVAVLLCALCWSGLAAAWPAESDWITLLQNSAPIADIAGDSATARDIVGTAASPAAYLFNDGSQLYYRIRLDEDPRQGGGLKPFGWGVLIDTDLNADDYEHMIMLDGIVNPEEFYLAKNTTKTMIGDPSDKAETIVWTQAADANLISGNYRVTAATPVDLMGDGNPDYFIEFRIPVNVFMSELGLTDSTPIRYFIGSSNSAQTLSADLLGTNLYTGLSNPVLPNGNIPTDGTVRFVSDLAGTGDETQFYVTDTLYVRVDDADQNAIASSIESLTLLLTTPSGDSETLTLTETGADTGIFTGSITTSGATLTINSGVLEIELIEYVTATYTDTVDSALNSDTPRVDYIEALPLSDLAVSKSVDIPTPNEADTVIYTVQIDNQGPSDSLFAQVEDLLPAGVTYVSHTASSGSYNPSSGIWTFGTLAVGASVTLDISATVDSGTANTSVTNSATIVTFGQPDPDPADNSASINISVQGADLQVSKSASTIAPANGDNVTFSLSVYNAGANTATNVQLSDLLPAGELSYVTHSGDGIYTSGTGLWDVGTLAVGATATLTLVANVIAPTDTLVTNTLSVSGHDQADPISNNDSASVQLYVGAADLALTKTVTPPNPDEGGVVSYTLSVSNSGPHTAASVVVADLLPAGVTYSSHVGGTYASGSGIWSVGTLLSGGSATLTINATVDAGTAGQTITNSATASSARLDFDTSNNSDTAAITVSYADLSVTKTVDNATPQELDIITFTITLTNNGIATATNIQATDTLPPQLSYSGTPSTTHGTFSTTTGIWTIPTLASGVAATLTVSAQVAKLKNNDPTSFYNLITIDSLDQADPNSSNDSASSAIKVDGVDIALSKTVNNPTPSSGSIGSVIYTITATNNGPNAATGLDVNDSLPTGLSYNSHTTTQGSYNKNSGLWNIGTLANGASVTLTLTANVDAGTGGQTIVNSAILGNLDQADSNTFNDTATATVYVGGTDLSITKQVDNPIPTEGQNVTFTLTVTNHGPNSATGISVSDLLPAGLTYVSDNGGGSYVSGTGVWTIGALANGLSTSLQIVAKVATGVGGIPITNSATVTTTGGVDSNSGNNSDSVSLTIQRADLVASKLVNDSTPDEGANVTYTLTIYNLGPHSASNIVATDLLPAGVTYVSHFSPTGHANYNPITGIWSITSMAKSTSAVLNITVSADVGSGGTTITNTLSVTGDQADSNPANNSNGVDITPLAVATPNISILKLADKATANPGDLILYTVQLVNNGTGVGTVVTLTDNLSPYVNFSLDTYGAGVGFLFTEGTPASGLSLGTPEYSSDNGATWGYVPASEAGGAPVGYDGLITNWRIVMIGDMAIGGSTFTLNYICQVK